MAEKVQGFQTNDGTFFHTLAEANAHEALSKLQYAFDNARVKNAELAINFIVGFRKEILEYLTALMALPNDADVADTSIPPPPEEAEYEIDANSFGEGQDDDHISEEVDGEPEEEAQAVQPLPPGVRKPVSDLGRHIQPTPIRHERPVNGPRGGKPDARGVRKR
jgi:hypothetical protein